MEGHKIVKAWKQWKETDEGRKSLSPYTLGINGDRSHVYLENRLESAFQAGIRAAENAPVYELNERTNQSAAVETS